ncbi:hypothetical protein K445DRAFT_229015 [Daldinia sp. EC12]|nr:hypothetical protein K445DRAFT_229015 [Daldinia sp. EC12]
MNFYLFALCPSCTLFLSRPPVPRLTFDLFVFRMTEPPRTSMQQKQRPISCTARNGSIHVFSFGFDERSLASTSISLFSARGIGC